MVFLVSQLLLLMLSIVAERSVAPAAAAATAAETAHQVLQAHGLPRGLLPRGIKDFRIDGGSGRFEAVLDAACTAKFEGEVHYNVSVSGEISYGQIAALSGVSAQELFLWFPVLSIRVDAPSSGVICFDVGVVQKRFPISLFESPPECTPDPSTAAAGLFTEGSRMADVIAMSHDEQLRYRLPKEDAQTALL